MAMASDIKSSLGEMTPGEMPSGEMPSGEVTPGEITWLIGRNGWQSKTTGGKFRTRLALLSGVALAGCLAWAAFPGPSDAESQPVSWHPPALAQGQGTSWFNPAITPTQSTLATPEDTTVPLVEMAPAETAPVQASPLDGLKISSQSWRRGGLGSKALVTFTLRNGNDYAVKDIEIACAFLRRDGSHLTDRTRVIHETVNMKSRKSFARLHVGFVNINANKAKCALVAASHI
jgi:hypothetical protein